MRNIYSGKLFYFYLTPRSLLDPPPPYAVQIISPSQLLPPASFLDYDSGDYTATHQDSPSRLSTDQA